MLKKNDHKQERHVYGVGKFLPGEVKEVPAHIAAGLDNTWPTVLPIEQLPTVRPKSKKGARQWT